jgi:dihydroorotate dehydrogenase (NAD+) catalytic subunit
MVDLSVQIGSLVLKNPVLTASGTFGYGTEYSSYMDVSRLGGIVTKTITLELRDGNPMPRIAETPAGMLNSIGLANVGAERFIQEKLPKLQDLNTRVIVNVSGNTVEEYAETAARVQNHPRVDAIEVNISCPNVKNGGLAFGTDAKTAEAVTSAVRKKTRKPVIVKLTPNVTDIAEIARAAAAGGADALSLINTVVGMAVDIETRQPLIAQITAGLSGPAIKPIALAKVYQVHKAVSIPLIGIGGIMRWQDAIEFFLAGAAAVQIGTLLFVEPDGPILVLEGIERYCEEKGVQKIGELVGAMLE